jgi:hypothetical protein
MMIKKSALVALVVAISLVFAVPAFAGGPPPGLPGGERARPVIYVESHDLYYDSIVGPSLPMRGRFQKLNMDAQGNLSTMYGPGDHGFVGGRWWVDVNGDNIQNEGDAFFSCPLLGPGRETK